MMHKNNNNNPTQMRLSTAIYVGIERFPLQAHEEFYSIYGDDRSTDKACVWGAAIFAIYGVASGSFIDKLTADYVELGHKDDCPVPNNVNIPNQDELCLRDVVIMLNDDYGWSREEIADWLESVGL